MRKFISLLLSLAILFNSSSGQECSKELLKQKPGTWKAGLNGQIVNVTAADLAKEKSVVASIHKMVSTGYSPTGCQILYAGVYGKNPSPDQTWIADPYFYSMFVLRYVCDGNSTDKTKYYVDYATPTTVNIVSNAMYYLQVLYAADMEKDHFRGYLKLEARPVKKDGSYFMGVTGSGDSHLPNQVKEYRWLITYNDTLPFSYLSRREYLLIQKKRLEKTMIESPSDKKWLEGYLSNINEYLKRPDDELSQNAICMWNEEERFEKFVEEGTRGSFIAVKPNLAYYHKNLPKSTPQFFTVVYKIEHGDPVFEENISNIQKAVDFAVLRKMLGK